MVTSYTTKTSNYYCNLIIRPQCVFKKLFKSIKKSHYLPINNVVHGGVIVTIKNNISFQQLHLKLIYKFYPYVLNLDIKLLSASDHLPIIITSLIKHIRLIKVKFD